ncbi:(2Fe-2S)-binding protein [Algicella marina]|uniref:2Fe-2S iron-sulfur cluster binding domain-containing protein n=1 Tax=Algicella marina TaxID=2683284 RepID=A0A6P1SXE2_9RHOB|nr:(2Fe-2S)-binding protein [Algicella marina]QHQ33689.1 2Fe-2S iron-sulfur cluster binding domain-containing protein [Algicella marina]
MATTLKLNGNSTIIDAPPDTPLLWAIRDGAGLTGTKYGCGVAMCGACTVHVDGVAVRSCQMPLGDVEGAEITTIEGAASPVADAVQAAWRELDVVQCGYCQSGQIMQAIDLLQTTPKPSDQDIDDVMSGNACRCATYPRIRAAIHRAAETLEG